MSERKNKSEKSAPQIFVLDCSVVFAWYFVDEANNYADAVARSLSIRKALVPSIWLLEVANTLLVGERRMRSSEVQASHFLERLSLLPIVFDEQTVERVWSSTIGLARTHDLSAYDAAYLELAIRNHVPLATLDNQLRKAAKKIGISIFQPAK